MVCLCITPGKPHCIRCRSGYFLSEDADQSNFGRTDCVTQCALNSSSSVSVQLEIDADSSQVVKSKDNLCLTPADVLNSVSDCFLYGPHLEFKASVSSFTNMCFQCHSYSFVVLSLFDSDPKGELTR